MSTSSTIPLGRSEYLPYIDGLRAIAVLGVMAYHLHQPSMPGGFSGVDIFFVISGFVVSSSVGKWNSAGIGNFLGWFYARRLQRIVPALVTCLAVTSIVSMLVIPSAWLSSSNDLTGLFAFFGLSNYFLAFHNENYFSPTAAFNPYTHTWSLGVEEQFYLLFPLLFFAWTRGGRWRKLSSALIAVAIVASILDAWHRATSDALAAFYVITTRFWELGAGVLLFQCIQGVRGALQTPAYLRLNAIAAWLFLGLMGWGLWHSDIRQFPYPGAMVPVAATLGVLACLYVSGTRTLLSLGLGSRLPVYIGRRSYSLYLWHWPVYVIMRWTCGLDSIPLGIAAVSTTFVLAEASYRFVECPFRYSSRLRRWPRVGVITAGLALAVSGWALSSWTVVAKPSYSLSDVARRADHWYVGPTASVPDMAGCHLIASVETTGPVQRWIYSRGGCPGQPKISPDLFAIGDSHTIGYATMLTEFVLRTGATVVLYPNVGCTFASLQPEREGGACVSQNDAEVADIRDRSKPGDILFLAALRLNRLSNQDVTLHQASSWTMQTPHAENGRKQAAAQLLTQLGPLVERGMHIVFEAPKPMFRAIPFRCADFFNAGNPACRSGLSESRAAIEAYRKPVLQALEGLAGQLGATLWDPLPVLCGPVDCEAMRDGNPLFFDGDHPSADGNRALYPSFMAALASLPAAIGDGSASLTDGR